MKSRGQLGGHFWRSVSVSETGPQKLGNRPPGRGSYPPWGGRFRVIIIKSIYINAPQIIVGAFGRDSHGELPPRFTPLEKGGKTSPKSWSKTDHGKRADFGALFGHPKSTPKSHPPDPPVWGVLPPRFGGYPQTGGGRTPQTGGPEGDFWGYFWRCPERAPKQPFFHGRFLTTNSG